MDCMLQSQALRNVQQLSRSLGHIARVFCVTFDRTGRIIFTVSDYIMIYKTNHGLSVCTFVILVKHTVQTNVIRYCEISRVLGLVLRYVSYFVHSMLML